MFALAAVTLRVILQQWIRNSVGEMTRTVGVLFHSNTCLLDIILSASIYEIHFVQILTFQWTDGSLRRIGSFIFL